MRDTTQISTTCANLLTTFSEMELGEETEQEMSTTGAAEADSVPQTDDLPTGEGADVSTL